MSMYRSAFTLIELVVVIAIIGVLTAFAVPNFMAARERARDAQRKNDLKQLQNALELYKLDIGNYPPTASLYIPMKSADNVCWYNNGDAATYGLTFSSTCPVSDVVVYMKKIVRDPNRAVNSGTYFYSSDDTYHQTYKICACLENQADSDGVVGDCHAVYQCNNGTGKSYSLTEP